LSVLLLYLPYLKKTHTQENRLMLSPCYVCVCTPSILNGWNNL
jgi:hypothetical protein